MPHKISLLEELKKGGYEASLITSYNAYLPFYEEVVLRRLANAGVRHNVLLMDASQYAVSLASHPPKLAGRQYTLMPIKVGGAFHPKLIFLAGKNKAAVLIGSHNMTISGFGFNRELTNLVRVQGAEDAAGIALSADVWAEIDYWLEQCASDVPQQVKDMVRRVHDFAPWLKCEGAADPDMRLLAGRPGGQSLWQQFRAMIESSIAQVAVSGPFFDTGLAFLDQVKQDLQPAQFAVAIDPDTAQIAPDARSIPGVSFVHAKRLGADDTEEDSSRYLHAKGILVQQTNGGAVFAVGSANPSSPAWLANEASGNIELMIARRGQNAAAAAEDLGFADIPALPKLDDTDWQKITTNADQQNDPAPPSHRTGLAIVEDGHVAFALSMLAGLNISEFVLLASDGSEHRSCQYRAEGSYAVIDFPPSELSNAVALHAIVAGKLALKLLLHHVRAIEEQARTGIQRRFKEALQSLETDTPNFELLLDCIQKIVFTGDTKGVSATLRETGASIQPESETPAPGTLAIDVGQIKKRKTKHRLSHSGDFAYLLDALIYHLRIHEDKTVEELDRFGRSEEEQIGADDDQDAEPEILKRQDDLLRVCHAKVNTVVNRMIAQLGAFSEGKQSLANILVRLLGVLAVLRELRRYDGRVVWVEKGKTTVPEAQRLRLLEGIMLNLFERSASEKNSSLLNLVPLGEEFAHSDDVARMKGLILWLAWDCGLTLNFQKPFMESRDDLNERLKRNAMVIALAQMIRADEVVIDEARQSIGSLTSSEMHWLFQVQQLADQCASFCKDHSTLQPAEKAQPGDVAVHRTIDAWDLRVVAGSSGNRVLLIGLGKDKERITYKPEHLAVARMTVEGLSRPQHAASAD